MAKATTSPAYEWRTVLRHRAPLRWMHWINLACMLVLVGSGLQVFNAHPALYWGQASSFGSPVFAASAVLGPDGKGRGITLVGNASFDTTGVLGVSANGDGRMVRRGFPEWATIPSTRSLALGRRWHFFFAWLWVVNGACYLAWSLASRHLARDLAMRRRDWRDIPRSIADHLRFRHPVGEQATRYNPLQKLAYLGVVFVLAPLALLTGLSMSPQLDSVLGWWLALVGGRQSARTLHFIVMVLFVLFALLHVLMVVYAGPVNELRSMLSGRFRVRWPRAGEAGDG
ncbi:cytochrome b/b6 domain-containing protein [Luteimonas sp. 50]|uniref:Cytochrome b/b6 domain-containing protein n=1 Tax=Cognatiluteimonas sedimenti TaxID=2927791 RepID=A0ABT0A242_9GAMM|nr:cytochrome b/b6 domain-containing protein [Lysobacter sedimenti]MCJ0825046.1 cytochrome b/b6 domain-containing protein [Lysobacter sedimenti]